MLEPLITSSGTDIQIFALVLYNNSGKEYFLL